MTSPEKFTAEQQSAGTSATSPFPKSVEIRSRVVEVAVKLFSEQGFHETSVEDIAQTSGVSRSTYFRQVGGKEDAIFADHRLLLEELEVWMNARSQQPGDDPWLTVCEASKRVFAHLSEDLDLARQRYQVVRDVEALRDREIITERRYEQLFARYLRRTVPGLEAVDAIGFAALVTATHNYYLRQAVQAEELAPAVPSTDSPEPEKVAAQAAAELGGALTTVRRRFGVQPPGDGSRSSIAVDSEPTPGESQLIVAAFPTTIPTGEVVRRIQMTLQQPSTERHTGG